jgi:hypothetical protein
MTERKPRAVSFRTWVDQRIDEAAEQGAFDNLPSAGRPLKDTGENWGDAWLRGYVRREGVPVEEMLPTPLALRRESEQLPGKVRELRTEAAVRAAAGELNERIMKWRRLPIGPPIFVRLVDEDAIVQGWRDARPPGLPVTEPEPGGAAGAGRARRRWWRRRRA